MFLKETLYYDKTDAPWAILILLIMYSANFGLFRYLWSIIQSKFDYLLLDIVGKIGSEVEFLVQHLC